MRRLLVALVVLALAAGAVASWQYASLVAFATAPHAAARDEVVIIPAGAGPRAVSEKLAQAGAISDARRFYWDVRYLRRVAGRLKAGEYVFKAGAAQSPDEIIDRLLKGEVLALKVTIPEGLRLDEQAPLLRAAGLEIDAGNYVRLARSMEFTRSLGIEADSLEGYLFPDTYLVPKTTTADQMLRLMVERFRRAWSVVEGRRLPGNALNQHQIVTLASIVEKETGSPGERPRISCVFHNRMRLNMKLQTDPTVIYSVLLRTGRFDGNLHRSDLDAPHPYNTYAVKGLPPGPIANAGERALEAALAPLTCDDLFFVSRNDTTHVFCPDLRCHEAAVEKWQREFFRRKRAAKNGP